jgi:TonB family protein
MIEIPWRRAMRKLIPVIGIAALFVLLVQPAGVAQSGATEMQLLSRIAQQPGDVGSYLDLAKLYRANKRFDEAEQMLLRALELLREERRVGQQPIGTSSTVLRPQGGLPGGASGGVSGGVRGGVAGGVSTGVGPGYTATQSPVRVGGDIKEPKKIRDVKPVYPSIAQTAGVTGVVILETIIATDGSVREAKILRSVPLLDQAALDAVYQWQFTPTLLNNEPVEVIMTVTVSFTLK